MSQDLKRAAIEEERFEDAARFKKSAAQALDEAKAADTRAGLVVDAAALLSSVPRVPVPFWARDTILATLAGAGFHGSAQDLTIQEVAAFSPPLACAILCCPVRTEPTASPHLRGVVQDLSRTADALTLLSTRASSAGDDVLQTVSVKLPNVPHWKATINGLEAAVRMVLASPAGFGDHRLSVRGIASRMVAACKVLDCEVWPWLQDLQNLRETSTSIPAEAAALAAAFNVLQRYAAYKEMDTETGDVGGQASALLAAAEKSS